MRELTVRLKFQQPCLGAVKIFRSFSEKGRRRKKHCFIFHRDHEGRVVFMSHWWQAILRPAANVLCRHQSAVSEIRFAMEVDGIPRPIPAQFYRRHHSPKQYSPHEAFFAGDVIGVSCVVPDSISDDDLWRLLNTAGQYYGISPFRGGNKFGFFSVESIHRRSQAGTEGATESSMTEQAGMV